MKKSPRPHSQATCMKCNTSKLSHNTNGRQLILWTLSWITIACLIAGNLLLLGPALFEPGPRIELSARELLLAAWVVVPVTAAFASILTALWMVRREERLWLMAIVLATRPRALAPEP